MQMYCPSLEPQRGLCQGADLSVLPAIKHTFPHANSLYDIGVKILSVTSVTRAMIADFNSLQAGLIFDASQIDPGVSETSEQSPFSAGFNIRSVQDPIGYTRATPEAFCFQRSLQNISIILENHRRGSRDFRVCAD